MKTLKTLLTSSLLICSIAVCLLSLSQAQTHVNHKEKAATGATVGSGDLPIFSFVKSMPVMLASPVQFEPIEKVTAWILINDQKPDNINYQLIRAKQLKLHVSILKDC